MKRKFFALVLSFGLLFNTVSVNAGQQLSQTDFEDNKSGSWQIVASGGGEMSYEVADGSFNVTIINPGGEANGGADRWDCQLRHRDIMIVEGDSYEVKWSVFPSTDGFIYTKIGNQSGDIEVWHNNATNPTQEEFDATWESIPVVGGEWNEFESEFTADQTIEAAEWAFHFGGAGEYQTVDCFPAGTILKFDNLSLVDTTSDENDYKEPPAKAKSIIRVNQVGYFPNMEKKAVLVVPEGDDTPKAFQIKNGGDVVFEGETVPFGLDADSGEYLQIIDFTDYVPEDTIKDRYNFSVFCENTKSNVFAIAYDIYSKSEATARIPGNLLTDSLNYFYQARSGVDIQADYITSSNREELARKAGHNPDIAAVQPEWIDNYGMAHPIDDSKEIDVTGGWYDAGDFGKYVVNAGISVWTLNNLYEYALFTGSESLFANDSTNPTPENGNGIPNILDETKFEMDFLNEMVVKDGEYKDMVYHKIHDYTWTGLALRPAEAGLVRIVKPPSTAATLNYVATAAQQSRLMSDFDTSYSDTLLAQAKASYEAAKKYPDLLAPMNQATGGGAYGDTDVSDEFYWAACELYSTTGEEIYLTDLKSYEKALTTVTNLSGGENTGSFSSFNWGNVASLGNLTLCLNEDKKAVLSKADSETLQQSIIAAADAYIDTEKKQGYSLPYKGTTFTDENNAPGQTFTGYEWGSNSFVLNNAVVLGYAYNLTHSGGYLNGVVNALNYILGMNGMDISYVTRYGSFYAENPHHRYWSFSLDPSFPKAPEGVLVGGPNSSMTDPMIQSLEIPLDSPPQICYVDNIEAWSVNECTINWNSPLAWVTGFLNISVPVYDATVTPLEVAPVETAPVESTDTGSKIPLPIILSVIGVIVVIFGGMIITNLKKRPKKED